MIELAFNSEDICIAAGDTMLPGYGYTDVEDITGFELPPGFNPLAESRAKILETITEYQNTGKLPKQQIKRAKLRAAEASDVFGTGKTVDRDQPFIGVVEEDDDDPDIVDLTDRAPRRAMPRSPEKTVADNIIAGVTQILDVRNRLMTLAQLAEHGTDLADTVEVRQVFEQIETEAKQLAVIIESSDAEVGEDDYVPDADEVPSFNFSEGLDEQE